MTDGTRTLLGAVELQGETRGLIDGGSGQGSVLIWGMTASAESSAANWAIAGTLVGENGFISSASGWLNSQYSGLEFSRRIFALRES